MTTNTASLQGRTLASLENYFRSVSHNPSAPMWAALEDLAGCLAAMRQRRLKPAFYLSSLDPGVGKTRTVVSFLRALVSSPEHDEVGVLLGVSRLAEAEALVRAAELPTDRFAVLT